MLRILLFLVTNIAILLVLAVAMQVLGISGMLQTQGGGLDIHGLLLISALVGMTGSFISLALSKWLAVKGTRARIIRDPVTPMDGWLVNTVALQAERAGIGMPDVAVYDSPGINAFATGMNRNRALVAVSSGLLQQMNKNEVEAVLGHEISHVANGDMITLSLIQGVVNTFVFFLSRVIGFLVDRLIFRVERGHGPGFWITVIIAQLVLGILASAVVMWFSRWREFRADTGGAELAGRQKMIAALRALQRPAHHPDLPDQLAAFGISGGFKKGLSRLFMSHPPLEERIAALEQDR